jgi:predicted N-acetyltransferase YhbS
VLRKALAVVLLAVGLTGCEGPVTTPVEVPAILLAKLAVDISLQGQGVGRDLLLDALERCVAAGDIAAARYVVVDAVDDHAASFYDKYGFQRIPNTDPIQMHRRLRDIASDLGG